MEQRSKALGWHDYFAFGWFFIPKHIKTRPSALGMLGPIMDQVTRSGRMSWLLLVNSCVVIFLVVIFLVVNFLAFPVCWGNMSKKLKSQSKVGTDGFDKDHKPWMFFTWISVLPSTLRLISCHLLPINTHSCNIWISSYSVHLPRFTPGSTTLIQRSRHCLGFR